MARPALKSGRILPKWKHPVADSALMREFPELDFAHFGAGWITY
jgi:hypothetical protein